MSARALVSLLLAPILLAASVACGPERRTEVTGIQVGRARNSDRTIAPQTTEFSPRDTIYAAVLTQGRGRDAKVRARWTFEGSLVDESEQPVPPVDEAVVPFELRNAGGFPPGSYRLEVFLNDTPAGSRDMRVKP